MMIELKKIRPDQKELLFNLNQKYLYEMTNYYDSDFDESGNIHYGYFDAYFTDPKRKAFLIYVDQKLAGFAMIHPYSNISEQPDHVMAEFTVFPQFRKNHIAVQAIEAIFERYPGNWEIKYNEKNTAARALWTKVTKAYSPRKVHLNDTETVLVFFVQ